MNKSPRQKSHAEQWADAELHLLRNGALLPSQTVMWKPAVPLTPPLQRENGLPGKPEKSIKRN